MRATYIQHVGTDLSVVNAARVSFGKKSEWLYPEPSGEGPWGGLKEGDKRLINYLARGCTEAEYQELKDDIMDDQFISVSGEQRLEGYLGRLKDMKPHHSPFNHTFISMHIKAPIFVARQLVKHKFMPWNEISRRYVDSTPELYWPEHWRARAEDKKQGSSDDIVDDFDGTDPVCELLLDVVEEYNDLLDQGVCPEQARMVLPLSTYTEWYWSGTLGAWADMYNLRKGPDVQEETRTIALECGEIIKPLFPVSWSALTNGYPGMD